MIFNLGRWRDFCQTCWTKQTAFFSEKTVVQTSDPFEEPKPPNFGSLQFPSPGAGNPNFDSKGNLLAGLQSLDVSKTAEKNPDLHMMLEE